MKKQLALAVMVAFCCAAGAVLIAAHLPLGSTYV